MTFLNLVYLYITIHHKFFFKFADDPDDVVELPILMTGRYKYIDDTPGVVSL